MDGVCFCLGLWQSELFVTGDEMLPSPCAFPTENEALSGLCLLAFEAGVTASPWYFSALAEHFRYTPITLHMVPYFCSALSPSSL